MKISDMIVSGLIKRGIFYEETRIRNSKFHESEDGEPKESIRIHIKCNI